MDIRRIMIVDNDPLVRRGLAELIDNEPDLGVDAALENCSDAISVLASDQPDLIITELTLQTRDDGLTLLKYVHAIYPDLPVMVLTAHALSCYVSLALQTGARGYLSKRENTDTLLAAIRKILDGDIYVYPSSGSSGHDIH